MDSIFETFLSAGPNSLTTSASPHFSAALIGDTNAGLALSLMLAAMDDFDATKFSGVRNKFDAGGPNLS
ncbi:MAG: hypothetical protein AAGJ40_19635, partial [Planctomycetota bacterium]